MTFAESIRTCLTKYADFNGVASRSEFWWFILFLVIVNLVASLLGSLVSALVALAMLLPYLAVGARRRTTRARALGGCCC